MNAKIIPLIVIAILLALPVGAEEGFEMDVIQTTQGDLEITFIGHGTLMFSFGGKVIHVDPWTHLADYSKLPKADLILVTHEHRDHLDLQAIEVLKQESTAIVANAAAGAQVAGSQVMKNGDVKEILGVKIEAVPAYNIMHMRSPGQPFHPKGVGNGYILTFGDKRVYVAGDTENTPEMVADAARAMQPKILYPYHFGETDPSLLVELLKDSGIDVRVRRMK